VFRVQCRSRRLGHLVPRRANRNSISSLRVSTLECTSESSALIPREKPGLNQHSVIESLESVFDPQVREKIVCGDEYTRESFRPASSE
jgi:hypothetical protein